MLSFGAPQHAALESRIMAMDVIIRLYINHRREDL
jgi:hypothetical protein